MDSTAPDEVVDRLCSRVAEIASRHPAAPAAPRQVTLLGQVVEGDPCCDAGWTELADGRLVRCPLGCPTPKPRVRVARATRPRPRGDASWTARQTG